MMVLGVLNAVCHSDYAVFEARYAELVADNDKAMEAMKQANEAVKLAQSKYSKLAAENAALKGMHHYSGLSPKHSKDAMMDMKRPFIDELIYSAEYYSVCGHISASLNRAISAVHGDYSWLPETPATDAFLAEVRAGARNEGINYAASRLAAAFNHGFLDKPVSEVLDVTRMILSAKEDLANDPLPAADGLSGEYAEKSIEEWATQLRKGAAL
ncbi:hypothetical protein ACT8PQ_004286 [Salmonella enterica subsp. enterica serovar Typhimurium]